MNISSCYDGFGPASNRKPMPGSVHGSSKAFEVLV
jgi:hypothetical protein